MPRRLLIRFGSLYFERESETSAFYQWRGRTPTTHPPTHSTDAAGCATSLARHPLIPPNILNEPSKKRIWSMTGATPSLRRKPRPMNKESGVDNLPLFLASSGKQYLALRLSAIIKSSSEFADAGAPSDCFASQFCNFEFSESRRRALVRSSALCARQWQLWPPLGPFPPKFAPRAQTRRTATK